MRRRDLLRLGTGAALATPLIANAQAAWQAARQFGVTRPQAQAALHKERTAAEYQAALEACQRAAQRMRRLTEGLLMLARLDGVLFPTKFGYACAQRVMVNM